MEKSLFTWDNWDEQGGGDLYFYDVELVKQIGELPVGKKFKGAFLQFDKGLLTFENYNDSNGANETYMFRVGLSILEDDLSESVSID